MFIIRNIIKYLSRMESCLWGGSCHHYSLVQRPISHIIHTFLANLSMVQLQMQLNLISCVGLIGYVSISGASGRGFQYRAGATY